ncbi:MAG: fumarate reductase cytochrome b subunit [Burkholderiaceae bacterium]|nr:fumarate reductase cytochrome b subunit [Burkholderiaceae bacterium]
MSDDFKDISKRYSVTPTGETIINGVDLTETKNRSKAYAWCDVLQSGTGLILGLFLFCHMAFTSSIVWGGKDIFWSLVAFTGGYFFDGVDHLWMHSLFVGIIFVVVIVHAILALRKFPTNYRAFRTMRGHYKLLRHGDTTWWWIQFLTGVALTALVFPHMLPMLTNPEAIGPYASGLEVYHSWLWVVFFFLIVTELHGMIGLYRLYMKWCGPSNAARATARKLTIVVTALMIVCGSFAILGYNDAGKEAAQAGTEKYVPGWLQTPQTAPYPDWWPDRLKKN